MSSSSSRPGRERWGAALRLIAVVTLGHLLVLGLARSAGLAFVASFGASLTLLFGAPCSPLGSARRALIGNVGSAFVGALCVLGVDRFGLDVAAWLAVVGAIGLMVLLDAMHPPGGATALLIVIGGPEIHAPGWWCALHPIGTGTLALIGLRELARRYAPGLLPRSGADGATLTEPT